MEMTLKNVKDFTISDFLRDDIKCACGKKHAIDVEKIIVENNAMKKLPSILKEFNYKKILMVADKNTYEAAGKDVEKILKDNHISYNKFIYEREGDLVPNEQAIGEYIVHMDREIDCLLTVGSGVLNDLSKFVSYKFDIDSIVVATAPSMDGYASDTSALIIDNLKTSLTSKTPRVILGDVNILKNAPMKMILAGLGDMIGKYSAISDWKLAKIIINEYYCDVVVSMVKDSLSKCVDNIEGFKNREDIPIKNLMEGLAMTGIAMSYIGNSRPASGAEHHLAHFWEMMFLFEGKEAVLHGTKVGITTLATNKLRELLVEKEIDFDKIEKTALVFDEEKWKEDILKVYKKAAPGILKLNKKENRNSIEERVKRVKVIKENWDEIVKALKDIKTTEEMENILKRAGAPTNPKEIGVDETIVVNSVLLGKEVRTRYSILQLLWDLDLLEEFSKEVKKYFFKEQAQ